MWPLTLTGPIRPSQDGALLHLAKGLEEAPHILLSLLLPQHPHEELPVLWREEKEELLLLLRLGLSEQSR